MPERFREEKVYLNSSGIRLAAKVFTPKKRARTAVVIAHGLTGNKSLLAEPLARELAKHGVMGIAFDFNGHGQSDGYSKNFTMSGALQDLDVMISHARRLGARRIGLVGHSFGGSTVLIRASRDPFVWKVATISSPATTGHLEREALTSGQLKRMRDKGSVVLRDWGGFEIGQGLLRDMKRYRPGKILPKVSQPLLVIHGTDDPIVNVREARKIVRRTRSKEKTLYRLGGVGHFSEPSKVGRVARPIVDWFTKH